MTIQGIHWWTASQVGDIQLRAVLRIHDKNTDILHSTACVEKCTYQTIVYCWNVHLFVVRVSYFHDCDAYSSKRTTVFLIMPFVFLFDIVAKTGTFLRVKFTCLMEYGCMF